MNELTRFGNHDEMSLRLALNEVIHISTYRKMSDISIVPWAIITLK
jgi:hypothetical protein